MPLCINFSTAGNPRDSRQQALRVVPPPAVTTTATPSPGRGEEKSRASARRPPPFATKTTASSLEEAIERRLFRAAGDNDEDGESEDCDAGPFEDSVQIYVSEDAALLQCLPTAYSNAAGVEDLHDLAPALPPPSPTILGIKENCASLAGDPNSARRCGPVDGSCKRVSMPLCREKDVRVDVSVYRPDILDADRGCKEGAAHSCCCNHPRGDWSRTDRMGPVDYASTTEKTEVQGDEGVSLKFVDLTGLQNGRRRHMSADQSLNSDGSNADCNPSFDTPGKVFHLLRSMLTLAGDSPDAYVTNRSQCGLHCASPWNSAYCGEDPKGCRNTNICNGDEGRRRTHAGYTMSGPVVAALVKGPPPSKESGDSRQNDKFWDELEHRELCELLKFRTGDAAPSYYLHSSVELSGKRVEQAAISESNAGDADYICGMSTVLDLMDELEIGAPNVEDDGNSVSSLFMLVYRHLPPRSVLSRRRPRSSASVDEISAISGWESDEFNGCMWKRFLQGRSDDCNCDGLKKPVPSEPLVTYRLVSPPYLLHTEEWPGLLDTLLRNIDVIREESRRIPQWAAWPERNHYDSSAERDDNATGESSIYPASWTVFPLCYTFPATDISLRKFIERACSFVPQTVALLRDLGPHLRTALFSRLDRRTTLGTHTGWADLANHVLRVHIPLIVPGGGGGLEGDANDINAGLCGTWVDGCVETHDEGQVVCFDDSKIHRAFNYTNEERIVLILDLERGKGSMPLPVGTATGGHTDELDAFIKELS